MKSANQNHFAQAPSANMTRSAFKRNHGHKTTFDSGYLIPFFHDEVLPGDTFHLRATLFARLMTPIFPVMDNMYLDTFFFFVPNRQVWDNWIHLMGEKDDPDDDIDWLVPIVTGPTTNPGIASGSLYDYFGLPVSQTHCNPTALFFRAYNHIWNEWFRSQDLQEKIDINKDSNGPDSWSDYVLLRRNKRHDYFTSCLPRPQKGDPVTVPLGASAPVVGNGKPLYMIDGVNGLNLYGMNADQKVYYSTDTVTNLGDVIGTDTSLTNSKKALGLHPSANSGMIADLSNATAATINSLREAFQLQKMLERDQRSGTRYCEVLMSHFQVRDPSSLILQRPEYLGGSSQRINVTVIASTADTSGGSGVPIGTLGAHAQVADQCGFHKSFTEHGMVIGLLNVRADMTYQYGLHKMFTRRTRYDFYWPSFAHLGEQEVLNQEIYFDGSDLATNALVFGYQERYAEYRYYPSKITGAFRSVVASGLDSWHLAQEFNDTPSLDEAFIQENPPIDRIVVSGQEGMQFKLDSYMEYTCVREMPVFSIPGLIDHF